VRLLLDECVPRKFKDLLPGHQVSTAREMGWSALRNGELLQLMRAVLASDLLQKLPSAKPGSIERVSRSA